MLPEIWSRRGRNMSGHPLDDFESSDYGQPEEQPGVWFGVPPRPFDGMHANLRQHDVTVHEDGTITVSPSILVITPGMPERFHGHLEHGVWRALDDCVAPAPTTKEASDVDA